MSRIIVLWVLLAGLIWPAPATLVAHASDGRRIVDNHSKESVSTIGAIECRHRDESGTMGLIVIHLERSWLDLLSSPIRSDVRTSDFESHCSGRRCRHRGKDRRMRIAHELTATGTRAVREMLESTPVEEPNASVGSPLKILLAEDGVVNQRVTVGLLHMHGHKVEIADNGTKAVAALQPNTFGGTRVREVALEMEIMGREQRLDDVETKVEKLATEVDFLVAAVQRL